MFTIRGIKSLGKSGVKWDTPSVGADVSQNIDSPEKKLALTLQEIKAKTILDDANRINAFLKAIQ